ncbi:hypothetical protein Are01nite_24060 [Actinoplanes regularis]|nr:hypothetical protein Are01nite_24060 [Actinoplanes regularis]
MHAAENASIGYESGYTRALKTNQDLRHSAAGSGLVTEHLRDSAGAAERAKGLRPTEVERLGDDLDVRR